MARSYISTNCTHTLPLLFMQCPLAEQTYSKSVRRAIDEFQAPKSTIDRYDFSRPAELKGHAIVSTDPIPGFTGFIPGRKDSFATTFGKSSDRAYDAFNHRDAKG
jgi:hypothetical protein